MTKNEVLALLPKLSSEELQECKVVIEYLLDRQGTDPESWHELYDVVRLAIGTQVPYRSLGNLPAVAKAWRKNAPIVLAFMEKYFADLNRVTRRTMLTMMVDMIIDHLKAGNAPVSLQSVVQALGNVRWRFEDPNNFPGYIEGGNAHLIPQYMLAKR